MTDQNNSQVKRIIIAILEENEEVQGTETLALEVGAAKNYVIKCARAIEHDGLIAIIAAHGGRGHKTIYKHNRNQVGIPRKVKR